MQLDDTVLKRGGLVQIELITAEILFNQTVGLVTDFGLAVVDEAGTHCFYPWAAILGLFEKKETKANADR